MLNEKAREVFCEMYKQGFSDDAIAKATHYSSSSIRNYRRLLWLEPNTSKTDVKRMQLYKQGLSDSEIAKELCFSTRTISGWRRRNKLPVNMLKGSKNYRYSDKERKEVIDLARNGMSLYEISKKIQSSKTFVRNVLRENNIMTESQKKYYARQAEKE